MTDQATEATSQPVPQELYWVDQFSDLLDSKFRIPGTQIRFGVDFLVGLIPYAGDVITYGFSSLLVLSMVRHGASGMVVIKMLWNILLDVTVGSIPVIGDLFDLQYRANRRNFDLLREHYKEGQHQGSAWSIILTVLLVLIALFLLMIWLVYRLASWGLGLIFS